MTDSIYQQALASGVEIDHHAADLYIPVTPATRTLIQNYKFRNQVSIFRSAIDRRLWFEIPFAYDPHYARASRGVGLGSA